MSHNHHYDLRFDTQDSYARLMSGSHRLHWLKTQIRTADRTPCWEWPGARNEYGYGRVGWRGHVNYAHRVAWMIEHNTELPRNRTQVVMHECDNPPCVNPDHLRLGTQSENIQKAHDQGTWSPRGEAAGSAKLTADDVRAIRASTEPQSVLAERFGVSQPAVSHIITGKTWQHVD